MIHPLIGKSLDLNGQRVIWGLDPNIRPSEISNWVERKHDVYLCNPCRNSYKIVSLTYTLYPNILMICFSTSFLVSHDLVHSVKTRIWAARAWFAVTQHHQLQQCHPRMLGGLEGGSLRAGEPVAGGRTGRTSPNIMNLINTLYIYTYSHLIFRHTDLIACHSSFQLHKAISRTFSLCPRLACAQLGRWALDQVKKKSCGDKV